MLNRLHLKTSLSTISVLMATACTGLFLQSPRKIADDVPGIEPQNTPGETRVSEVPLPVPVLGENQIRISSKSYVPVRYIDGRAIIPVEGLIADKGFSRLQANASLLKLSSEEKREELTRFVGQVLGQLKKSVPLQDVFIAADVGYFSAWVAYSDFPQLKGLKGLPVDVVLAPRVFSNQQPHDLKAPQPVAPLAHADFAHFSGIERMGVSDFLKAVTQELGQQPTGHRVRVGVTDTGVTFGHPAFLSSRDGRSRVTYMKDFTNEGAGFVSPLAKVSAKRIERGEKTRKNGMIAVNLSAEYLAPEALDKLSASSDSALPFSTLSDEIFLLPERLVSLLEQPETSVRLGVISEAAYATRDEKVDVNGNGKTDDQFYFFHVPSADPKSSRVWIDFSATGNFKASKGLRDFNLSGDVVDVMSERIGVSLSETEIQAPQADDAALKLSRISIVGFDPGNHGSHVTGIIGAGKTLSNDSSQTLARGVAPESNLMVNRVCSNNGGCNATRAIIDLAQSGARIINMSLGGLTSENTGYGVQETVINRLTELYDVLFVISAGNSGPGRQTVGSPSTARHALSVAATGSPNMILRQYNWIGGGGAVSDTESGDDDFVMYFSSRGPTAAGGFKPNISAPGTQLSVIQLNAAPGFRAGSDVYWGTSMAAPAAAGAAALLLDAAMAYNEKNPEKSLPTDSITLRRVLLDSARPFNVTSYNPLTGAFRKGIYTWIDQGYGMVSLPAAWELLKKSATVRLSTGVELRDSNGSTSAVPLDYQIRVLRLQGNGKKYDGSQSFKTGSLVGEDSSERKFGQGIWLTEKETDKNIEVHLSRRLPLKALARKDVGDLLRQLNTSSETFQLETTYHGSRNAWLKVGIPQSANCDADTISENNFLTVIGSGAVDTPVDEPGPALTPFRTSSLFLCLKKAMIDQLTPGDHGAIIRAYRVVDGKRDALVAFEVPVYLSVPHHSASLQAKFTTQKQIKSFSVDRHYVRVPEGVSVLRVALEVPLNSEDAKVACSGVSLMVLKGSNTASPADLAGSAAVAQNCNSNGSVISNRRVAQLSELNPSAGIWDIHVFGRFQFPLSTYKLDIDYATFADVPHLNLTPATAATGEFPLSLRESTFDAVPESGKSAISLNALLGRTKHEISEKDGVIVIPSAAGKQARTYRADAGTVTITTTSVVAGLDIDITVDECDDVELKSCKKVAESGNAAAEERAVFLPKGDKFYAVRVDPFEVPVESAVFSATEEINAHLPEKGKLRIVSSETAPETFQVQYVFETASSVLLQDEMFKSGQYEISGECKLVNAAGVPLLKLPVHVLAK